MGLYRALVSSSNRFRHELPPLGFTEKPFHWEVEFPRNNEDALGVSGPFRGEKAQRAELPDRQRSGKRNSPDNVKPYLTADQPLYIFSNLTDGDLEQRCFLSLHEELLTSCEVSTFEDKEELMPALRSCVEFLRRPAAEQRAMLNIPYKEKDLIRFVTKSRGFSDYRFVRDFWARKLGEMQSSGSGVCGVCGSGDRPVRLLKTMPVPLRLFDYMPAVTSFTPSAFDSFGKEQMDNSPVCIDCGMLATAMLAFLIKRDGYAGRHAVVLAEESKQSAVGRPLANQIAVFWTKEPIIVQPKSGTAGTAEDCVRLSLDFEDQEFSQLRPSALSMHIRNLLESPWYCRGNEVTEVNTTGFYFAVLSPNKSRLVVREWLETSIDSVRKRLIDYRDAACIVHPQTGGLIVPPLRVLLQSLRGQSSKRKRHDERPRLAEIEPELLRELIRCMYDGANPPEALLTRAVRAFGSPAIAADEGDAFSRLCNRRTALAAAIKLVLTFGKPIEMNAMEQLETPNDASSDYKHGSPYLCGRLLAILNDIQYRASASRRGPNTTLVDKFFAAASTAPQSVFGSMLRLANTAHLPKIRKDPSRNYPVKTAAGDVRVSDLLSEVANLIDSAPKPGLPRQLTPRQQGEFALGYHHQQAVLSRPQRKQTSDSTPSAQSTNASN